MGPVRRKRAAVLGALFGGLFGCGKSDFFVSLPPTEGARSMLLALDTGERLAFDLSSGPATLDWSRERPLPALEAWMYARELSALGLSAGPIAEDTGGTFLPVPSGAFRRNLARGELTWTAASTSSSPLGSLKIPKQDPCRPLQVENLLVGDESSAVASAASLGDGRMLLVLSTSALWVVGESGAERIAVEGLSQLYPSAVALDVDGRLYLGTDDGPLARGVLTGTTVRAEVLGPCRPGTVQVAVGPLGEVFALSVDPDNNNSEMVRFDGSRCLNLGDFPRLATSDTRGGIVAPNVEIALGGTIASPFVYVYDHGDVRREQPGESTELISALTGDGSGGVLVGTSRGGVLQRQAGRWVHLFSFDSEDAINALIAIPGGVLFGTVSGAVGYYTPEDGLCLSADVRVANRPVAVAPSASGWIFAGARPFATGPTQVGIVHFKN
ncbi:MAG: hypothetical protein U1E65_03045 [Myxococcota bacterium]